MSLFSTPSHANAQPKPLSARLASLIDDLRFVLREEVSSLRERLIPKEGFAYAVTINVVATLMTTAILSALGFLVRYSLSFHSLGTSCIVIFSWICMAIMSWSWWRNQRTGNYNSAMDIVGAVWFAFMGIQSFFVNPRTPSWSDASVGLVVAFFLLRIWWHRRGFMVLHTWWSRRRTAYSQLPD